MGGFIFCFPCTHEFCRNFYICWHLMRSTNSWNSSFVIPAGKSLSSNSSMENQSLRKQLTTWFSRWTSSNRLNRSLAVSLKRLYHRCTFSRLHCGILLSKIFYCTLVTHHQLCLAAEIPICQSVPLNPLDVQYSCHPVEGCCSYFSTFLGSLKISPIIHEFLLSL